MSDDEMTLQEAMSKLIRPGDYDGDLDAWYQIGVLYCEMDRDITRLVANIDDEWTAELIYDENVAWNMECKGETESSWPEYAELTEFAKTPWRSMAVAARLAITGGPLAAFTPQGDTDGD